MHPKFTSAVIFVRDMRVARKFYEDLLGQKVEMDLGVNVSLENGLALWQADHAETIIFGKPIERPARLGSDNFEIYFEAADLDEIWQRLEAAAIPVIHPIVEQPWGQRVFRVYDPDGHVVEFGEEMSAVILRMLKQGMQPAEVAAKTFMPEEIIRQIAGQN